MLANRIVVCAGVALVVVVAVDAIRTPHQRSAETPTTTAPRFGGDRRVAGEGPTVPGCRGGAIAVRIGFAPMAERRRATVIVQNLGARPCYGGWTFLLALRDRAQRQVGWWADGARFRGVYAPGTRRVFSLPGGYPCDRPGPYVAVAAIGPYTARRGGLSRTEIGC
jgi:hypothetical protein